MSTKILTYLIGCLTLHACVFGYEDIPACYRELETNFFLPALVSQGISLQAGYQQYQNTWPLIIDELQRRSTNIPQIIKDKASRMRPDPLDFPFQADIASELLWSTLYELFASVVSKYNITDVEDIQSIFNYIRRQQEPRLKECLGELPKTSSNS